MPTQYSSGSTATNIPPVPESPSQTIVGYGVVLKDSIPQTITLNTLAPPLVADSFTVHNRSSSFIRVRVIPPPGVTTVNQGSGTIQPVFIVGPNMTYSASFDGDDIIGGLEFLVVNFVTSATGVFPAWVAGNFPAINNQAEILVTFTDS